MNPDIKKYLLAFELEEIQEHKNMAVGLGEAGTDHNGGGKGKLKYSTNGKQKYNGNGKQKCTIEGKQNCRWDFRLEGEKVVGSALVYNKKVIHTAFFRVSKSEKVGDMSSAGRRREFRTGFLNEEDGGLL